MDSFIKQLLMKRSLLILTCLIGFIYTHGQVGQVVIEFSKEKKRSRAIAKVEVKGPYPGGDTAWRPSIERNLNASSTVIGKGAKKGKYTVVLYYIISKDGAISDIRCENDPGYNMCQEALRIIKKSKTWVPANQEGRIVHPYRH
jgi:protein TonB